MWYKVCDYIVRTQSLSISKLKCGKQFKVQLNYHSKKNKVLKQQGSILTLLDYWTTLV